MGRRLRANPGKGTVSRGGEVVDVSVRGDHTLRDAGDLVLEQGYTEEYAARRAGFPLHQVQGYVRYQRSRMEDAR